MLKITAVVLSVGILAGCADMNGMGGTGGMGAGDYSRSQSRQSMNVRVGTVESVRTVTLSGSTEGSSLVGTGVGAILGGVLGNQIGGGRGRDVATVLGAVGGGVAGNMVEGRMHTQRGLEITVRLNGGQVIAVTQADEGQDLRRGDRVQVLTDDRGVTRVQR